MAPPSRSWIVGRGHDRVQHEALGVDQDMPLLALDLLAGVVTVRIDPGPALLRALHTLGVDDRRSRAGLPCGLFATLHIERVMQPLQSPVMGPSDKVLVDRAPRRQVLRDGAPLTPGAEDVHHPVRHLTDIDRTLVAAALGRRNQRPDLAPLRLGQIALVAQMAAVIAASVLTGPHPEFPPNSEKGKKMVADSTSSRGWSLTDSKDSICSRTDTKSSTRLRAGGHMDMQVRGRGEWGSSVLSAPSLRKRPWCTA